MRTRRSYFPPTFTIPRRSRKQTTNVIEPEFRTIVEMADNRTMAQMLQALIEGYEDAIVVPQINANNFNLKQTLINLVQSNQFTGRQDPHNHLRFFKKVTSTFRHPDVPNTTIKLLLFPFSLEGEARIWLDKEPPRSIMTWEDLIAASLEDKLDIRMNRFEKSLNDMKNSFVTPIAPIKAVEEALFLRSKDETPEVLKDFLTMIQINLQASVITVRTDEGTEFLNKTLNAFFREEGIEHQTSTAQTPKQNGVVERQNRTLVEAAQMMLSASQLLLFF
nr:putative ribonuclease H-like domain-containing protein [Tanacetum cinerariifolium]